MCGARSQAGDSCWANLGDEEDLFLLCSLPLSHPCCASAGVSLALFLGGGDLQAVEESVVEGKEISRHIVVRRRWRH